MIAGKDRDLSFMVYGSYLEHYASADRIAANDFGSIHSAARALVKRVLI